MLDDGFVAAFPFANGSRPSNPASRRTRLRLVIAHLLRLQDIKCGGHQRSTAAATVLETSRSNRPLSTDRGRLVSTTQISCVRGSAHATVPLAPACPKASAETRSPNSFQA